MSISAEDSRQAREQKKKWSYNRYFEDYDEYYVPKKKAGKYKVVRVFNGECYCADLSKAERIKRKALYMAGWLLAITLLFYISTRPWACNSEWYVALPVAISLAGLCWLFLGVFHFMLTGAELTSGDYKSSSRTVINASRMGMVSFVCAAAMMLLSLMIDSGGRVEVFLGAMGYLLAALCLIAIERTESRTVYRKYKSEHKAPVGGLLIRR